MVFLGNVYIDDFGNNCIRKVTVSTGIITTVAGTCSTSNGFSGDGGAATSALLHSPQGVAVDLSGCQLWLFFSFFLIFIVSTGNIYIADTVNNRIRKVTVTGVITTVAGSSSTNTGFGGDGGAATSASFHYPKGLAIDTAGNMYIADSSNQRIRKVTVSVDIISTIAGSGSSGYSGDNGAATSATLHNPDGVAVDSNGNVYIADDGNNRIRKVTMTSTPSPRYFLLLCHTFEQTYSLSHPNLVLVQLFSQV